MTRTANNPAKATAHSVLVVSDNTAFIQNVSDHFFEDTQANVSSEAKAFHTINGQAPKLAFANDVVLFEARPDDEDELRALTILLENRLADTVFLGLTDADMSIGSARKLREIGVDDVLPLSISRDELNGVIDETLAKRRGPSVQTAAQTRQQGEVIAVAQARGGIGATTLAVNLACGLVGRKKLFGNAQRRRVALLDLDLQFGNANVFFDLEDNGAFQKMIEDQVQPDAQYLKGMVQSHESGVDVVNAPSAVLPLTSIDPDAIGALVDEMRAEYDFVVIDLPRALVEWLEPVIKRTSRLQIVTDQSIPSIRQTRRLIDFYHEAQIGLPVDLIVNGERKPMFKSSHCREAERVLDGKFEHWLPPAQKIARKAADVGKPLVTSFSGSALSKAITKLARATDTATKAPKNA